MINNGISKSSIRMTDDNASDTKYSFMTDNQNNHLKNLIVLDLMVESI